MIQDRTQHVPASNIQLARTSTMIAAVLFTPALKVGSSLPASRGAVSRVSALEMAAT